MGTKSKKAPEGYKLNTKKVLKTLDGEDMFERTKTGKRKATVGTVCVNALATLDLDEKIGGAERFRRGKLAEKIHESASVRLTIEDAKLLKDLVGKQFGPLEVVQVWPLLDPNCE